MRKVWTALLLSSLAVSAAPLDVERLMVSHFHAQRAENGKLVLTDSQRSELQKRLSRPIAGNEFSVFTAKKGTETLGHGVVISGKVRKLDQSALYYITKTGEIDGIEILSFQEHDEYRPKAEWLNQLKGLKADGPGKKLGQDIQVVTGSTMTAETYLQAAELALALWRLQFATPPTTK